MSAAHIKTEAPRKGDLVVGHTVYIILPSVPAVPATVVAASDNGHSVTVAVDRILATSIGMTRTRWVFTWRAKANAYQPKGEPTRKGVGLALHRKRFI